MMTLEYLHPQQAESMYLHHPSATGNFQQQGNHHHAGVPHPLPPPGQAPSAHHHHQFETAEYWRQLQGVGAGGAEVGISPSTAAASSAAVAAAAAAAAATTTAAHHPHHHHQPNAGSVWAGGLPVSAAAVGGSSSTSTTPAEWQQYIHHASQNSATVACPQAATSVYGTEEFPGVHGQGQAYVGPGGIQTVAQALHRPMMTYDWMKSSTYRYNPQTGKTRTKDKYRVVYTDHQRLELEKEFHYSRYITIRRKSELAIALGLSERQVKIWFQNRRAKERKLAKKIKMQENKTSPTQQQQQQQQQQQRHSQPVIKQGAEEAEPGPRQKDYNHNNNNTTHHNHQQQQQQQQQHQQQHNQHHHAMQQHSITPQHHHQQQQLRQHHLQVTDLSDTKPKMPIIISTMKPSSITTTTSTTSPPALDDERRHDVLAEDVSGSSHALVTVPTIISSSQQIPITAADVVGILGSKATVLQA